MAIPDYQAVMLPLLTILGDGTEHRHRDVIEEIAKSFGLTEEERKELLPSGRQAKFDNRVGWARTYLVKAGLLHGTKKGWYHLTQRGREVLETKPGKLDAKYLERFPEFCEFKKTTTPSAVASKSVEVTPEEQLEQQYQALRDSVASDLLEKIKTMPPSFLEKLVVDLLLAMGYGGSRRDAGAAVGQTGDGGIDGIIKEDRLGLDAVYVQAKRWEKTVGRPEVQSFAGSLDGVRSKKGIFITTSRFSPDARKYVRQIEKKIILIDGEELAAFMIDHNVGVSPVASYEVKKLDHDYFEEGA